MSDLRIHAALSPRVAVLSSPDVDRVVQRNGIPDLPTLLRPFEFSVERLSVRTSQLETRVCDRFPLRFDPYSLFNPDAARAISSSQSQAPPRPSVAAHSHEELLDRVNQLIATNIKTWHAQVPRPALTAKQPASEKRSHDDEEDGDKDEVLEETLRTLQRGSLEETAPWFAAVQKLVFGQRTIAKHESFGHPVAVLLVVSSASPDPMNEFAKLYELSAQASPFPTHPYINPDTLKYYVLIHDVQTSGSDLASSKEILEQIKRTYGLHCCLLAINSASEDRVAPPDELVRLWAPHLPTLPSSPNMTTSPRPEAESSNIAASLDEEDVKRIKAFIRELTAQSIVPFMERYVQHMGEHLANSRKGLTNRLFGASRKLFGGVSVGGSGDKSGSSAGLATSGGYDPQHDFYPHSSIEAQTRRLADFAFTIRDYKLAASMYDLGRKDFAGDKAYRHAAGATEMFGLSHLMIMYTSRSAPIDVDSYLAQACQEYGLRSSARANAPVVDENHALRATLLYYEAYRMLGYLRPAPAGLVRMSAQSDEVLSPLLLEQAALACLQLRPRASLRKFALHLVTAAHKYQACGQKLLSLRCYALAAVVYREKGWALIENHIEHELGLQAYNEGDSDAAVTHLLKLIRPSSNSAAEHEAFLSALRTAYKYSGQAGQGASDSAPSASLTLSFPVFDTASASLRFVPESSASATSTIDEAVWERLEQELIDHGLGEQALPDGSSRRRKRPTTQTSTQARQVPINQTFWLEVQARNPLGVELTADDIRPVLETQSSTATSSASEAGETLTADDFEAEDVGAVTLGPFEHRMVRIPIRVRKEARSLRVASVTFRLAEAINLVQKLDKKGKRLNATKEHRMSVTYGPDLSLAISVHAPRPTLLAKIVDAPAQIFLGEQVKLKILLKNEGRTPVMDLRALCDQPEAATFAFDDASVVQGASDLSMANHLEAGLPQPVLDKEGHMQLEPGHEAEVFLTLRPVRVGVINLAWILPFSSDDGETYLSRMALSTQVSPALQIGIETKPSRDAECLHDVVVEASNRLSHDHLRFNALSVLSPHWKIVSVSTGSEEVVIPPKQAWRGRLQIEAVDRKSADSEAEEFTATKLQDLLLSRDTRRPRAPDIKLRFSSQEYGAEKAATMAPLTLHREARKVWRTKSLAATFPTLSARDRLACFTLWEPRDFDILMHFSVQSAHDGATARNGQMHVYGLQPGPLRSQIRAITHPRLDSAAASQGGQIRSLYAETIREKASLLQNILTSRLAVDQNPVVAYAEAGDGGEAMRLRRYKLRVRNFSDRYTAKVEVQLSELAGAVSSWVGRKTLRCELEPGSSAELVGNRREDEGAAKGIPRFVVITESYLPCIGSAKEAAGETRELIARYVEHH